MPDDLSFDKTFPRIRGTSEAIQQAAREMRFAPTPAERLLWDELRSRKLDGLKFRFQHAVGPFILDFYCPSHRLVVELDGDVHDVPEQAVRDTARTAELEARGYHVIRFRNREVEHDLTGVLDRIRAAARSTKALES